MHGFTYALIGLFAAVVVSFVVMIRYANERDARCHEKGGIVLHGGVCIKAERINLE